MSYRAGRLKKKEFYKRFVFSIRVLRGMRKSELESSKVSCRSCHEKIRLIDAKIDTTSKKFSPHCFDCAFMIEDMEKSSR